MQKRARGGPSPRQTVVKSRCDLLVSKADLALLYSRLREYSSLEGSKGVAMIGVLAVEGAKWDVSPLLVVGAVEVDVVRAQLQKLV